MVSYYNEIDPYAAQWLRNLIANKLIADGDVDERSICDVAAADLRGYTQCHFFAGIGVWSYALRLAGWPDDRPVWTGSCPCQPFSAAGKQKGFDDERHLWPVFHRLIDECRPPVVFGEQVASKDGLAWLDTVFADLEGSGYAAGAADLCAAGVGAPHIRQRLWFVGERLDDTASARHLGALAGAEREARNEARLRVLGAGSGSDGLADAQSQRYGQREVGNEDGAQRTSGGGGEDERLRQPGPSGASGDERLEHAARDGRNERRTESDGRGAAAGCGAGGLANADEQQLDGSRDARAAGGREPADISATGGLADTDSTRSQSGQRHDQTARHGHPVAAAGSNGGMADAGNDGSQGRVRGRPDEGRETLDGQAGRDGADCGLEHASSIGRERGQAPAPGHDDDGSAPRGAEGQHGAGLAGPHRLHQDGARPTDGHWRAADWLHCRDGKWRPVEPGTFPLAHGAPARVGRLRAYGNAIVPQVAAEVIAAYMECADA